MKLTYTAYDRAGRKLAETLDAVSLEEGAESLRKQGLFVVEIAEDAKASVTRPTVRILPKAPSWGGRKRLKHVSGLARQMSVLVSTGTPLIEALASMERQAQVGSDWQIALADIRRRVEEGTSFSKALQPHAQHFDAVARSLIAAGEEGGRLSTMLDRLARLTRQQVKIRGQINGALIYPSLLIVISIGVVAVMLGFVMPRFEGMFASLGAKLPPTTRVLLDSSAWFRGHWYWVVGAVLASGVSGWIWSQTDAGRRSIDRVLIMLPILGPVIRSFATARLARVIGVLVEGRVPLLEALQLAREAAGNAVYADLVAHAEDAVTKGEVMSGVFHDSGLLVPGVCEAIKSGEKTGQLGPVLTTVADALDEDNEVAVKALTSLIEPLILLALGVVVGGMAMSMFLPLFDLTAAGGGGAP
jgi:type IV pilus assembly protein PilC